MCVWNCCNVYLPDIITHTHTHTPDIPCRHVSHLTPNPTAIPELSLCLNPKQRMSGRRGQVPRRNQKRLVVQQAGNRLATRLQPIYTLCSTPPAQSHAARQKGGHTRDSVEHHCRCTKLLHLEGVSVVKLAASCTGVSRGRHRHGTRCLQVPPNGRQNCLLQVKLDVDRRLLLALSCVGKGDPGIPAEVKGVQRRSWVSSSLMLLQLIDTRRRKKK